MTKEEIKLELVRIYAGDLESAKEAFKFIVDSSHEARNWGLERPNAGKKDIVDFTEVSSTNHVSDKSSFYGARIFKDPPDHKIRGNQPPKDRPAPPDTPDPRRKGWS